MTMVTENDVHEARVEELRARKWQIRVATLKEGATAAFVLMGCVVFYLLVTRLWHHLPR